MRASAPDPGGVVRRWNAVDLVGTALPAARVMVNGKLAQRDGARFVFSLPLADGTTAHLTNLTVTAALADGTAEQYATRTFTLRIPACPETIDVALAGATVGDSLSEYLFDARNRLRRVTDKVGEPRLRATYDYYPDGRRARKIVSVWTNDAWQASCTNQFMYDRWNLVREVVASDGATTTRDYTWGLDLAGLQDGSWGQESGGIGGLLAITEVSGISTNILLPISDHVGTIHALVAAMTNSFALSQPCVVETRTYSPYGDLIEVDCSLPTANCQLPTAHCPFGFQSKYYDPETGFWYYGYRYYDAKSCKWLTADPLQEVGGLNLTAFCGGDPVNQVDALGLEPQNVIQLFMPGSATSHPYRNYGDFTDEARWRPLELSQIGAATDPNAWSTIGQVVVAGAGAGAAVGLAGVGAVVLAEAAPLAYVAAWGTTHGGTATGAAALKYGGAALSADHVYNFTTDTDYAGATMSVDAGLGVSSVYIAGRNVYETGMGAARSLGARYPMLNPGNNHVQASPAYGSTLGNLKVQYRPVAKSTAYRAVNPKYAQSTLDSGFYRSGTAGRLGNDGIYANSSIEGAIAEFQYHNPGVKPTVFEVNYPSESSLNISPPSGNFYIESPLPFTQGANVLAAPSLRAPGTINYLIREGVIPERIVP